MSKQVASGILRGRPFGGVVTLINNRLRSITETICCDERYSIVRVANYFIVNVYLPCVGTSDRLLICDDVFENIMAWRERYSMCECIIAGDFNVDLDSPDPVAKNLIKRVRDNYLVRCDDLYQKVPTYVNNALGHSSCIDYTLVSSPSSVHDFAVLDPDINFSDHLPLKVTLSGSFSANVKSNISTSKSDVSELYLRWDKADRASFYAYTGSQFSKLCNTLDEILVNFDDAKNNGVKFDAAFYIDTLYDAVVNILCTGANAYVPRAKKNFYKFWWSEELDLLKQESIDSNNLWKAAGKPRSGPIFSKRQSSRLLYRKRLRDEQKAEIYSYSNDLHEALLKKDTVNFWKCWRSKLDTRTSNKCSEINGCVDHTIIVDRFAEHFSSSYCYNSSIQADSLREEYEQLRGSYYGHPIVDDDDIFGTEMICRIISNLKRGKAPGIDGLSVEHLSYSHPAVPVVISKLFKLIFACGYVPSGFKQSYIVPIPKIRDCRTKAMTYDDFRGIAISPVISKIFEHCLLDYFQTFLSSGDNQFDFKKGVGCSHAIQTVRNIVNQYIKAGYTANLCAIDLSKAFDKINHHALYIKLMKRQVPNKLLDILENWLCGSYACVKWGNLWSNIFTIKFGVRQGSVLSPVLFAIYIDDVSKCSKFYRYSYVILYADDILLLAPTVTLLDRLFTTCEVELTYLDMAINSKKSCCLRVGSRCDRPCNNLCTSGGHLIPWVDEMRYLGLFIVRSHTFKCSLDYAKRSFYRAVNGIFGRIGRTASEEVILELIKSKCLPILLYGLEACPLNKTNLRSLDFSVNRFFMKLFNTSNIQTVSECQLIFGFKLPSAIIADRSKIFLTKYDSCNNLLFKLSQLSL